LGCQHRCAQDADNLAGEHGIEYAGELAVTISDQEPELSRAVAEVHQLLGSDAVVIRICPRGRFDQFEDQDRPPARRVVSPTKTITAYCPASSGWWGGELPQAVQSAATHLGYWLID
jgi:hypothetical protein